MGCSEPCGTCAKYETIPQRTVCKLVFSFEVELPPPTEDEDVVPSSVFQTPTVSSPEFCFNSKTSIHEWIPGKKKVDWETLSLSFTPFLIPRWSSAEDRPKEVMVDSGHQDTRRIQNEMPDLMMLLNPLMDFIRLLLS